VAAEGCSVRVEHVHRVEVGVADADDNQTERCVSTRAAKSQNSNGTLRYAAFHLLRYL
jgi:hypothetical protein